MVALLVVSAIAAAAPAQSEHAGRLQLGVEAGERGAPVINGSPESEFESVLSVGAFGYSMCSASLITTRVVLTAAHCSADFDISLVVSLGEAYVGTSSTNPDHILKFVDVEVHPDYEPLTSFTTGEYDLALLVLSEDAPVEPIWFRTKRLKDAQVGSEVVSVGFGLTETGSSGEKRSATLVVDTINDMFVESMAATNDNEATICSGDSGGPQFFQNEDGTWEQWAVHSWADQGCEQLSGSTRVDVASDWILAKIEEVHGTTDQCAVMGRYGDGLCDETCDDIDPDCQSADPAATASSSSLDDDSSSGGCSSTGALPTSMGVWVGLLALARRRRPCC